MPKSFSDDQIKEIYSNETRNMIVRLLRLHNELSLAQFSTIMNMNKTTIQYHLKILREKDIIYESRESTEDSRGSIPTKYFQLKYEYPGYHTDFNDIKKIGNTTERLDEYSDYLKSLVAGLKDIKNLIFYAEEALENGLKLIERKRNENMSTDQLEELHDELREIKSSLSSFSTTKKAFLQIQEEIPKMYKSFEKIHSEKGNAIEGFEIITLSIPLLKIIESRLEKSGK